MHALGIYTSPSSMAVSCRRKVEVPNQQQAIDERKWIKTSLLRMMGKTIPAFMSVSLPVFFGFLKVADF
jgi:hypothetical protein